MADAKKLVGGLGKVSQQLLAPSNKVTAAERAEAGRKAAELIKSQPQVKASEALGQLMEKGFKKTTTTQADRTRVGKGNIGGAPFPAISEADPNYADKVWGVFNEGTANRLINLTSPDTAWTTMLGTEHQLKTNPIVFDKLKRGFVDSMKQGNLSDELADKINHNLAITFGEGADIRDPKIWKQADTFEKRAALSNIMMGKGIPPSEGGVALGGEKSGKGVIFRPSDILKRETEPYLLHTEHGGDVPTFAAGPRLFRLDKETEFRPDLHPGFPTLIKGKDLEYNMAPVPTEIYLPDWHAKFKKDNPNRKPPSYFDLALGVKGEGLPSQDLNDEYIRHLLREGNKDGGVVDIDAADARLAAEIEKRMAKGGSVDIEAADARLEAAINARMGMAEGGEAGFKKIQFMADGGKLVKGVANVGKRLLQDAPVAPKVKPPSDNVVNVRQANFRYPKTVGNQTVGIDKLSGGVRMSDPNEVKRVKALADQIASPEGYISRIIVDHNDNVIEGQHRLEALRQLGIKDVPVYKIEEMADTMPVDQMTSAVQGIGAIHPDHVGQIINHALESIASEGVEGARQMDLGRFQKHYNAALDAITSDVKKAEGGGAFKKLEFMADGGKLVKGATKALKKLFNDDVLPTAEREANKAKFLSDSKVKDRLYHATNKDFKSFRPNHRGAHFVTPDRDFANQHIGDDAFTGLVSDFEEGANIMPVHVQVKKPFDYENLQDVKSLFRQAKKDRVPLDRDWKQGILEGNWDSLENEKLMRSIKNLGHDSFYVTERLNDGEPIKNLGIFDPKRIKSDIGNRGTYDIEDADITKADGGKIVKGLGKIRKKLFADSNVLPQVEREANLQKFLAPSAEKRRMYHGTKDPNITEFRTRKDMADEAGFSDHYADERDAVFLSPDPDFTKNFSIMGYTDEGMAPTTYPVYAQVERPFDFDNPEHLQKVKDTYRDMFHNPESEFYDPYMLGSERSMELLTFDKRVDDLPTDENNWMRIENPKFQDVLKDLGFDSFYTRERGTKNLGVYEPNKIKSATGNQGTYDLGESDITKADGGKIVGGLGKIAKKLMADNTLPAVEREANLQKFLEPSKIKDRLYHGTKNDVSKFDVAKRGSSDISSVGGGVYLTPSPNMASMYSKLVPGESGSNVMPVYAQVNNSFEYDLAMPFKSQKDANAFSSKLQEAGYDSIIKRDKDGEITELVVFDPNKIKSATGNRGTYDINEPDLNKSDGGKIVKGLSKVAKKLLEEPRIQTIEAPSIIIPSKLSNVREAARKREGEYGARRVERASDEIPNLEKMYQEEALRSAFIGDNARALMTINPADFENYAAPLKPSKHKPAYASLEDRIKSGELYKDDLPTDEYVNYLRNISGGFESVPFLEINKGEQGLPLTPFISGHEGRHRNRALASAGEDANLIQLLPRAELREPFPRRSQEEYIDALKKELAMTIWCCQKNLMYLVWKN